METLGDILRRLTLKRTSGYTGTDLSTSEGCLQEPSCPICGGLGWVRREVSLGDPDFGKAILCQCRRREIQSQRVDRLQRYSNLGSLTRLTFSNLNQDGRSPMAESQRLFRVAYEASLRFAQEPRGWIVLTGPSGCGKTHMAAAIANQSIQSGCPAFFVIVPDLLDHLRSTFAPSSDVSYDELFERVRETPLLILDDLGAHSTTPWAQEKLHQILNHRFNAQLPTVVTVGVPLDDLEERVQVRLQDSALSSVYSLAATTSPLLQQFTTLEPALLQSMTFQSFDVRGNNADQRGRESLDAAKQTAMSFSVDPDGWLVLAGHHGRGKTHLAVAIANERIKKGEPVLFCEVPRLLDAFRSTFSPESSMAYDELLETVRTAPFLILDDLGAESSTPWAQEKLYQIIVHRHNARLPTIITTTLLLDDPGIKESAELKRRNPRMVLDEAISSRLKDPRLVTHLPIYAPDYRNREKPRYPSSGERRRSGPDR